MTFDAPKIPADILKQRKAMRKIKALFCGSKKPPLPLSGIPSYLRHVFNLALQVFLRDGEDELVVFLVVVHFGLTVASYDLSAAAAAAAALGAAPLVAHAGDV